MSAGRICVRDVDTATANETVQAVAERMLSRAVGALVVLNDEREPIGIVTDRDLTIRVLAAGKDGAQTRVCEVMTAGPRTVREDTPIEQALAIMRAGRFRRLPVIDKEGKLAGLLSLDDVLELLVEEFRDIGDLLGGESPICQLDARTRET